MSLKGIIIDFNQIWTHNYLLPLFDWKFNDLEPRGVWQGFLWSPRLYWPLLSAFKSQFLETTKYYVELGEFRQQYAAILTYAALDNIEGYAEEDFAIAIGLLPQEGLDEIAQSLSQALEGAGKQRENYWKSHIKPFWQNVWPKSRDRASNAIASSFSRLIIAAGKEFPSALLTVQDWLHPIEHLHYVVSQLCESDLTKIFPEDTLQFLDKIVKDQEWPPRELRQCLESIADAAPQLERDIRYRRLDEYCRRHNL